MAGPYFLIRIRIPLCEKILFWSMTLNSWIRIWKKWTVGIRKIAVKEGTGTRTYANIMKYLNGGKAYKPMLRTVLRIRIRSNCPDPVSYH